LIRYIFLTKEFYKNYKDYSEIEKKPERPHVLILINFDNLEFAIPLRSSIKHNYAVWTNKKNKCGLDLSKSIVITNKKYIDSETKVYIRPEEHKKLIGKEYFIKQKLETYIKKYKKALKKQNINSNKMLCDFSTLKYFHKELKIPI
jgi:protein AbiQ